MYCDLPFVFLGFCAFCYSLVKLVVFINSVVVFRCNFACVFLFDLIIDGCIWCHVFVDLIVVICCCLVFVRLVV